MIADQDISVFVIFLLVFLATCCVGLLLFLRAHTDKRRAIERLRDLSKYDVSTTDEFGLMDRLRTAVPSLGAYLLPNREDVLLSLKTQLLRAGYFAETSMRLFMGVKLLLLLGMPVLFAAVPYFLGWLDLRWALTASVFASVLGTYLPNIWLRSRINQRQTLLRRGLPDVLDMLVLCVEGGLTFSAALQRVTKEMFAVHPVLALECTIIEREIQLGSSPGKALQKFADRCGLDEVRDLASVVIQSEQYGASIVKALRTHADSYRDERQQQLEETAQKAAVKILFPTLICIFPAIFIVVLGPAAIQISDLFSK